MSIQLSNNLSSLEDTPRNVHVKLNFLRIGEIDTMGEKYSAEVQIESKWSDFNPEIVEYKPKEHWNPELYIQNVLTELKSETKYEIKKEVNCSTITETKNIKAQFWERLELNNFPFDLQELNVVLSTKLDSSKINLVTDTDNFSIISQDTKKHFIDQQKWKLMTLLKISKESIPTAEKSSINIDIDTSKKKKPQKLIMTAFARRHPEFYLYNATFLIFLITGSVLTTFAIDNHLTANRLQTTYTILLSSISFKWVINRSLPAVSYLTLLDLYSIVSIVFINAIAGFHAVNTVSKRFKDYVSPSTVDFWAFTLFSSSFVFIQIISFIWFLVVSKKTRTLNSQEKEVLKEIAKRKRTGQSLLNKVDDFDFD